MASTDAGGINAAGLGVIAAGLVISWAGLRNQSLITAFKDLAMGQMPTANPKPPWEDIEFTPGPNPLTAPPAAGGAGSGRLLQIAASYKGQCYGFGAGHGRPCSARCTDCSSYVSCCLFKAGLLPGGRTMTTNGLATYGRKVPFAQRAPGDILVWIGGPGGGHCGIAIDGSRMWHNACTGCGGVQIGSYGPTRTGRTTLVRRPQMAVA